MKSMETCDKLYCFLVSNEVRDYYGLSLFIRSCEREWGLVAEFHFAWDALVIRRKPPKLVVLPNCRGNNLYYEIADYCNRNSIPIFYGESEGNYLPRNETDYWGYNLQKRPLCPVTVVWNERVRDFLTQSEILTSEEVVVTGSGAVDRFSYLSHANQREFLESVGHGDKKMVVGYAGWAFGKLHNKEIGDVCNNIGFSVEQGKLWLAKNRDIVEGMLRMWISENPDVLFVLKKHPRENFESDLRDSPNEMNSLVKYPNVLYVRNEHQINDLIAVSNLWTAFESTSLMEAWLLKKPTLILHGIKDFKRSRIIDGTVCADDEAGLVAAMRALREGDVSWFDPPALVTKRERILCDSIGFADGLNGHRMFQVFKPFFVPTESVNKPDFDVRFFKRELLKNGLKFIYSKQIFSRVYKLKKMVWVFENQDLKEVKANYKRDARAIDAFFRERRISFRDTKSLVENGGDSIST